MASTPASAAWASTCAAAASWERPSSDGAFGDKDGTEGTLAGWEIHLFNGDLSVHLHDTTDSSGEYSFSVPPGTYTVCENTAGQTGWQQSFPTASTTGSVVCPTGTHTHAGTVLGGRGYSVTGTSGNPAGNRDFGNTPLSTVTVTFNPLADLPGGGDATKATAISCTDSNSVSVGSVTNNNTLTTSNVKTSQSKLTCEITYSDP